MKRTFLDLPDWSFDIDETSAGVYQVVAIDKQGHLISAAGIDPEMLVAECRSEASNIDHNSPPCRLRSGN